MKKLSPIIALTLLALPLSCTPDDGTNGVSQLVRLFEVESGNSYCPHGGLRIATGADLDGNGILTPSEEVQEEYICNQVPDMSCNCEDGKDGSDGAATLFVSYPEDPGENCEFGGILLKWGVDYNGDGALTSSEYTPGAESYICNGDPGVPTLVTLTPVEPGLDCEYGGIKVTTGVDDDEDGFLQPLEIDDEQYVCNGPDGATSLVSQEPEPAGPNCAAGGIAIHSGLDLNDNNILESTEILQTSYVCD